MALKTARVPACPNRTMPYGLYSSVRAHGYLALKIEQKQNSKFSDCAVPQLFIVLQDVGLAPELRNPVQPPLDTAPDLW